MTSRSHLWFGPWAVTTIVCAVYIVLGASLLFVHHVVPRAPSRDTLSKFGVNLTEAWLDLQHLSTYHHPYNSRKNDLVRNWLLHRVDEILNENGATYSTELNESIEFTESTELYDDDHHGYDYSRSKTHDDDDDDDDVVVFNDLVSNATYSSSAGLSVYFEGTNIIVYVRGTEDTNWWRKKGASTTDQPRGVLVNAHYDSVSTSFGTTDDGVGVVTILQLIKYFTTSGNRPRRGIVALFNNGEEDYLNGAYAFSQHPIARFPNSFLNLEGAGAGGRAACFRATDTEVLQSYKKAPHPFGDVVSADSFKRGLVKSETDYAVFTTYLGLRGLDVAFVAPRARYHTLEDSTQFTDRNSVWHMLSNAVETMKGLTSSDIAAFEGAGSDAVYFDMMGRSLGLLSLHSMFALSVSLLVLTPLVLVGLAVWIKRQGKMYLFARKIRTNSRDPGSPDEEILVEMRGWRGLTRYPIAFVVASALTVAFAFLVAKVNPYITYSSPYPVWSMLVAAWICIAWFLLKGSDIMRPTALHRAHAQAWLFALFWLLLIVATVMENNYGMGSGYPFVIAHAAVFVATLCTYSELLLLPNMTDFVRRATQVGIQGPGDPTLESARRAANLSRGVESRPGSSSRPEDDSEATETTSLIRKFVTGNRRKYGGTTGQTSDGESARESGHAPTSANHVPGMAIPYKQEQAWSGSLPSGLWIVEFLLMGPLIIILFGQIGLFLTSALPQTAADGSPVKTVYAAMAILTIMLLIPASPYLHRFTNAIPTFLLLVFVSTLIYNLAAFPFSDQNRLKLAFQQTVDLDTGVNTVTLTGIDGFLQKAVGYIPSAAGQEIQCGKATRPGVKMCSWTGIAPNVVPFEPPRNRTPGKPPPRHTSLLSSTPHKIITPTATMTATRIPIITTPKSHPIATTSTLLYPDRIPLAFPPETNYKSWIHLKTFRPKKSLNEAFITLHGQNTRNCKLVFDGPLDDFTVQGSATSDLLPKLPKDKKVKEIRLWSRDWNATWHIHVEWSPVPPEYDTHAASSLSASSNDNGNGVSNGNGFEITKKKHHNDTIGLDGKAVCMWSDINMVDTIPAYDEAVHFLPRWAILTKLADGLVEGSTAFMI